MNIDEAIRVVAYPGGRHFSSMETAVRNAMSHPRLAQAKDDAARLQGNHFIDACWSFFEWYLQFANGIGLRIWIEDDELIWVLEPMDSLPTGSGLQTIGAPPVMLNWSKTIGYTVMDPSSWIDNRRGATFKDLFYSEHGLFLYLNNCLILHFGQAVREIDGRHIIYVREDD